MHTDGVPPLMKLSSCTTEEGVKEGGRGDKRGEGGEGKEGRRKEEGVKEGGRRGREGGGRGKSDMWLSVAWSYLEGTVCGFFSHHLCLLLLLLLLLLLPSLPSFLPPLCRYPIVSMGVLRWVEHTLSDPTFFEEAAETSPLFLVVLDEVYTTYPGDTVRASMLGLINW